MAMLKESPSAVSQTPQKEKKNHEEKEDSEKNRENDEVAQVIDDAMNQCQHLLNNAVFNARTKREYMKMLEDLQGDKDAVAKIRGNVGYLLDTIREAESYRDGFEKDMQEALSKGWINKTSYEKWWDRFNASDVLEWTRKEWIHKEFPPMMKRWKEIAEKRDELEKEVGKRGLTEKDIPELKNILNKEAFLSLHYLKRKDLLSEVRALMKAIPKDKERTIRFVQSELKDWAAAGYLHPTKIGKWMERVMNSENPDEFITKVLYPFRDNWIATREDYDKLNAAMKRDGPPQGFQQVSETNFLLMNYKQRTSYCSLAWIRIENAAEENKKLASMKLHIRHDLDMKDWEGAEARLEEALSEWPEDRELLSMRTFAECHKPKQKTDAEKKENPDPQKLLANLRSMLGQIGGDLHSLYAEAMESGLDVFEYFEWVVRNRVWVHENGYATEEDDIRHANDEHNKQLTQEYIEHGHGKESEHNILDGMTATDKAIRDDCTKPQTVYVDSEGKAGLMHSVKKNAHAKNAGFPYWTTVVFKNTTYSVQANYVKNLHYPMKSALRQLDRMGYRFTVSGSLQRKGMNVMPKKAEQMAMAA
jgi:hypothetical protein